MDNWTAAPPHKVANPSVTGWTYSANGGYGYGIGAGATDNFGKPWGGNVHGTNFVLLDGGYGATPGYASIEQTITGFALGQAYSLAFSISSELPGYSSRITVRLTGADPAGPLTFSAPPCTPARFWDVWTNHTVRFIPFTNAVTIRFEHIDCGDSQAVYDGTGLDNVYLSLVEDRPLMSIRVSEVEVCWTSVTNATYRVEYRSDLATNTWVALRECIPSAGTETCIYDRVLRGQPQRFYRVVATNYVPGL